MVIQTIAVIGAGTMGCRIAHTFASHGRKVNVYESFAQAREGALSRIQLDLDFMVQEGALSVQQRDVALQNICICDDLGKAVASADYVIECIFEDPTLKQELFAALDALCPPHTIFSSNTSSLSLAEMINRLPMARQAKSMICHWYHPAHLVPIAELTKFGNMSEEDFEAVYDLYVDTGKQPICVLKDIPGMVANRMLHALARETFSLVSAGVATADDIDKALKYGPAFRAATTGMLEGADMGGLDIWCATEDGLFPSLDNSDRACDLMRKKVYEGKVGLKSGEGFYLYPKELREEAQNQFFHRLIIQSKASKEYT